MLTATEFCSAFPIEANARICYIKKNNGGTRLESGCYLIKGNTKQGAISHIKYLVIVSYLISFFFGAKYESIKLN